MNLQEMQLKIEAEMHGDGVLRFGKNNERALSAGAASETAWFRRLTKHFVEPFGEAIQAYLDHYEGKRGKPAATLSYLRMLPVEVSAYVAVKVIFDSLPQQSMSLQMVAERIGRRIEDQVRFTNIELAAPKYVEAIKKGLKQNKSQKYEHQHAVMVHSEKILVEDKEIRERAAAGETKAALMQAFNTTEDRVIRACNVTKESKLQRWSDWPKANTVQLGSRLIDIFANSVQYNGEPVVFKEEQGRSSHKSICYLSPTAAIVEWVAEFQEEVGQMAPCFAPCVIPPRAWTSTQSGGFHTPAVASRLPLVKLNSRGLRKRLNYKQMPEVYDAVNALQSVSWQVSSNVLDIASRVLEKGLPLGLPQREPIEASPAPIPESLRGLRGQELRDSCTAEQWDSFIEWKRDAAACYDAERERRCKYMEAVRTIGQGKRYNEFNEMFFVYALDFRGRVYAQSSLIGPQGGDLQKGLIRFSKGKALGENGKKWLAAQGAGVCEFDDCHKGTFDQRAAYIYSISEDIRDIAANPMQFKGWAAADKPWQFLNFCFEWAALCDHEDEGKPASTFISHLPIAQDGSCSGIQHYSAMLRDPVGGAAVNLVPSELPQDIYNEVASVTMQKLHKIKKGALVLDKYDRDAQKRIAAAWLEVVVTRDTTKKSVMTLPYGSSQLTCRTSVGAFLDTLTLKESKAAKAEGRASRAAHPFSKERGHGLQRFEAEKILSLIIWESIGEVVVAARAGMKYIKDVTAVVAKENMGLEWITPTGFIVQQAIYETKVCRVETQLMGGTIFTLREPTEDIDLLKMKSACAPNFVHSMDASHLVKAVAAAAKEGMKDIAVIHDSFGTYAADTDKFREILLDTFIELYQTDVLEDFKEHNEGRCLKEISVPVPESLGLDLEVIRGSNFCFG